MVKSQRFVPQGRTMVVQPFNYLVYFDGTNYKALNGTTGIIDKSNANASITLQYAIDNVPAAGGLIIVRDGTFPLGTSGLAMTISGTKFYDKGGAGASSLITYSGSGYALDILNSIPANPSSLSFSKIHDLRFDGITKTTGRHGFRDQSEGPVVFHEDLYFRNFDDAYTVYNSNNRHAKNIRIVTANTGVRILKGGTITPPNAFFLSNFYISDCATAAINLVSDVAGETATPIDIRDGVIETNGGDGIIFTGYPVATTIDSIYFEGNGGADIYIKGVNSTFPANNVLIRNCRGRGNVTSQPYMIKIDDADKVTIENCVAVSYTDAMILLNKNAEFELTIINPTLDGTPFLIKQSTARTTSASRLAGTVIQNRATGHIALLPASTTKGDVVIIGSAGRYVSTGGVADSNVPGIVMYPSAAVDTPGVIYNSGSIAQVNVNGAVAVGDTLSTSTTAGQAKVNNAQVDPKKVIGFALETTGGAGLAWCKIL